MKTIRIITLTLKGEITLDMKMIRQFKRLSQGELSERCGLPQSRISNIETGRWIPTTNEREKIEKALGWPVSWHLTTRED